MSFKVKSLNTVHRYQSIFDPDRGTDKAATFLIRTLNHKEAGYIRSLMSSEMSDSAPVSLDKTTAELEAFRIGLCGWEGVTDEDGNEVPFRTDPDSKTHSVHPEIMDALPTMLVFDIAKNGVIGHNFPELFALKKFVGR